jgi:hypothetical protein
MAGTRRCRLSSHRAPVPLTASGTGWRTEDRRTADRFSPFTPPRNTPRTPAQGSYLHPRCTEGSLTELLSRRSSCRCRREGAAHAPRRMGGTGTYGSTAPLSGFRYQDRQTVTRCSSLNRCPRSASRRFKRSVRSRNCSFSSSRSRCSGVDKSLRSSLTSPALARTRRCEGHESRVDLRTHVSPRTKPCPDTAGFFFASGCNIAATTGLKSSLG